jgi:hypothetical protein
VISKMSVKAISTKKIECTNASEVHANSARLAQMQMKWHIVNFSFSTI